MRIRVLQMGKLSACVTILEESQEVSFKFDDAKAEDDEEAKVSQEPARWDAYQVSLPRGTILTTKSNQNALL